MTDNNALTRENLRAPRAAAIAGIVFSLLFITSLVIMRLSVPADPIDSGRWLTRSSETVRLALGLLPFAGLAFLWFIGVLRDRLGASEDKFFATVFFGSGLLFIAMIGYTLAVALLIGSSFYFWAPMAFPLWVLLVSVYILVANLRGDPHPNAGELREQRGTAQ